jgi:CheY-like chemotaxis protein/CHASE3 domain sensor protein
MDRGLHPYVAIGLLAALAFFAVSTSMIYLNIRTLNHDTHTVAQTHNVLSALDKLLSTMKDAETGQRGFLLTGEASYRAPYDSAVSELPVLSGDVARMVEDDLDERRGLELVQSHIAAKLAELKETIDLRRASGLEAAMTVVRTDRGKREMEAVRDGVAKLSDSENDKRRQSLEEAKGAYTTAVAGGLASGAVGALLTLLMGFMLIRTASQRALQDWLLAGRADLSTSVLGDPRPEELGRSLLRFFGDYLDVRVGAIFFRDGGGFEQVATAGAPPDARIVARFSQGQTLLGQAAEGRTIVIDDVSETYLTFASALGSSPPRHIVIAPASADGAVNAVVELGFMRRPDKAALTLLAQVSETMGVAVRTARFRDQLQNLLGETQRQAEELAAQSEELRVSNEELEEQSRVLKESQTRLENSSSELEQINSALERQRDDLAAATQVAASRAREADQANRTKSEFLANMSHELRTPLNSLLILAKLLGDNPQANLSSEQVRYARTIYDSGNDLLTLINDILDLSKVEAGQIDVKPEAFSLGEFAASMRRSFEPVARDRGLAFEVSVQAEGRDAMISDRRRLEQIVKNLLANAFKFTQAGSVALHIEAAATGIVSFAVVDTGIGIAADQQGRVFEAFQQADGTISRKYGGTGLGLSISRELARRLDGDIALESEPGRGSTFTLTAPAHLKVAAPAAAPRPLASSLPIVREAPLATRPAPPRVEDDRDRLSGARRVLLIVEDDNAFARILQDFAHEMKFETVVAGTAEEALRLATELRPHAVVLDLGLPDRSGLTLLDDLKHDAKTRHIPVHVVSASKNAETALSLGAVGYLLKPVQREQVLDALRKLEDRLDNRARRVLVVEDDAVQREAVAKLLEADGVVIETVGAAEECLAKLKAQTYDCMVLDLTLPDATGYALLETLSREDAYSFPPVIVYTGRDLSADEEQQLRRYSHAIIIKGAKSPERLLDEVTLFLHQVVAGLSPEQQTLLRRAQDRDETLEGKRVLIVEDDVRNIYALTSVLEPRGVEVQIARNGREAVEAATKAANGEAPALDLVLMDVMMPEMDGLTATREIRKDERLKKLPILMLTAKAMPDDQERCLEAGASDYMAKPLDVDRLLSLVRVWMPR